VNAHTQYCQGNKSTGGKIVRFGCQEENNNSYVKFIMLRPRDLDRMPGLVSGSRVSAYHWLAGGGGGDLPSWLSQRFRYGTICT
jgi:hypothetical protein